MKYIFYHEFLQGFSSKNLKMYFRLIFSRTNRDWSWNQKKISRKCMGIKTIMFFQNLIEPNLAQHSNISRKNGYIFNFFCANCKLKSHHWVNTSVTQRIQYEKKVKWRGFMPRYVCKNSNNIHSLQKTIGQNVDIY